MHRLFNREKGGYSKTCKRLTKAFISSAKGIFDMFQTDLNLISISSPTSIMEISAENAANKLNWIT